MNEKKATISPENFKKIVDAIYDLGKLPENWNKHGALQIEGSTIKRAIRLLHAFLYKGVLKEEDSKWFSVQSLPTDEEIEEIITEAKKIQEEYFDDPDSTKYYWGHLDRSITPCINYWTMDISPTFDGGIEFSLSAFGPMIELVIPPDEKLPIFYSRGIVPLDKIEPEYLEENETFDYNKIADVVYKTVVEFYP